MVDYCKPNDITGANYECLKTLKRRVVYVLFLHSDVVFVENSSGQRASNYHNALQMGVIVLLVNIHL